MIDWLIALTPILKSAHIAALLVWCGGLLILPVMLARHDPSVLPGDYTHIRRASHSVYTYCVTPAAVIAVIAGTWLVFLREAFVPWFYAKITCVALLVAAHVWIGHALTKIAEEPGTHIPPRPILPMGAVLGPVLAILILVLAKPQFGWLEFPDWLLSPQNGQLLFDVPSR